MQVALSPMLAHLAHWTTDPISDIKTTVTNEIKLDARCSILSESITTHVTTCELKVFRKNWLTVECILTPYHFSWTLPPLKALFFSLSAQTRVSSPVSGSAWRTVCVSVWKRVCKRVGGGQCFTRHVTKRPTDTTNLLEKMTQPSFLKSCWSDK